MNCCEFWTPKCEKLSLATGEDVDKEFHGAASGKESGGDHGGVDCFIVFG